MRRPVPLEAARPAETAGPASRPPVALFMFDLALSGVARNGVRMANALAARGFDVHLLLGRDVGQEFHRIDPRVTVTALAPPRASGSRARALAACVPALRRHLAALRPRTLVSLGNHAHLPVMLAATGLRGIRRLYRISNDMNHHGESAPARGLRRWLMAMIVRSADRLILVSPHLLRNPLFGRAHEAGRVEVVPNGVAVDEIRRLAEQPCAEPWLADGRAATVVAIGRLVEQKNYPVLLRAIARANAERPVRLLVIGEGSDAARARLTALADALGIADRVKLLGSIANPFPYVARAAAFVLPSLWEGASNALLEALACGTPVVASRTAGNAPHVLGYGRYGLIVEPDDADAMARALLCQTGGDPCRPGDRARDFEARTTHAALCAIVEKASRTDGAAPAPAGLAAPVPMRGRGG